MDVSSHKKNIRKDCSIDEGLSTASRVRRPIWEIIMHISSDVFPPPSLDLKLSWIMRSG